MQRLFLSYKRLVCGLLRNQLSRADLEGGLFYLDLDRDNVFLKWPADGTDDFRPYADYIRHYKTHCGERHSLLQRFVEVSTMLQDVLRTAERQGRVCWLKPGSTRHSRRSLNRLLRRNGFEPKDGRLTCYT